MDYRDLISVEINGEGAFSLTALVEDPKDTFGLNIGPFYKTVLFYLYDNLDEAIDAFVHHVTDEMGYVFVEDDNEDLY